MSEANNFSKVIIGVLGAGTMGSQIASLFASHGIKVILWNHKKVSSAYEDRVRKAFCKFDKKNTENFKNISFTNSLEDVCKANIIFEAIVENKDEKGKVYRALEKHICSETILATNTSSISLDILAGFFNKPTQFIGVHFFNPIKALNFVEIISLPQTSSEVLSNIQGLLQSLNLQYAFVPNIPGYVVNRVLFTLMGESIRILESNLGDTSIKEIDKALKLGAAHPMGPFELADFIGLDVCLNIFDHLYAYTNDNMFKPAQTLINLVNAKKLGRKTGEGFYQYGRIS